ncbi:hypothetical protein JOM56_004812 [Amanita muscaria]
MATVTTPPMTIRQVIDNLESPIDSSKLHLIITAPTLQLNENGSVFGDLRLPNMIFAKDNLDKKVKFIDFDWSGCYKGSSDGLIPDPKDNEMPHYPVDLMASVHLTIPTTTATDLGVMSAPFLFFPLASRSTKALGDGLERNALQVLYLFTLRAVPYQSCIIWQMGWTLGSARFQPSALFFKFPDEPELFGVDALFLVGGDILTVSTEGANISFIPYLNRWWFSSPWIFPGKGQVTWCDWYTHNAVTPPRTVRFPYTIYEMQQALFALLVSQARIIIRDCISWRKGELLSRFKLRVDNHGLWVKSKERERSR